MDRQVTRRISILLTALLLLFTAVLASWAYLRESKKKALLRQLSAQSQTCQQEIERIRRDVANRREAVYVTQEKGMVTVCFLIADASEYEVISRQMQKSEIIPSVMVNGDQPAPEGFFSWMQETGFEMMLSASELSRQSREALQSFRQTLDQQQINTPGAFLIRGSDYSREKLDLLAEDGLECFVHFYQYTFDPVVRGKIASLSYGAVTSDATDNSELLSNLIHTKGNLVIVFDMKHLEAGALTEQGIEKQLQRLHALQEEGKLEIGTLEAAIARQKETSRLRQQAQADFEAYEKAQEERIAQLQQEIDEIYDQWEWS